MIADIPGVKNAALRRRIYKGGMTMKLRLGWLLILVALGLNACRGSWGAATIAAQSQVAGAKSDAISGAWILIELFPTETHTHRMSLQVADNNIPGQSA